MASCVSLASTRQLGPAKTIFSALPPPVEARSEHPIAAAIVAEAHRRGLTIQAASDVRAGPASAPKAR